MRRTKKVTLKAIQKTQKELNLLAASNDNELLAPKIYRKSCQLDQLIVEYMKNNAQMELIFAEDPVKTTFKKRSKKT